MRAGKVVAGEFMVENGIKDGSVHLVLIAEDASDNTKKKFRNMCDYRKIPFEILETKESLGKAIGKDIRATIGITDEGFTKALQKTWR